MRCLSLCDVWVCAMFGFVRSLGLSTPPILGSGVVYIYKLYIYKLLFLGMLDRERNILVSLNSSKAIIVVLRSS